MQHISPQELQSWLDDAKAGRRAAPQLIDVREPWEFDICRIDGAQLLPLQSLPERFKQIDPSREAVMICHHGVRSMRMAQFLEDKGYGKVINLSGGVAAWAQEVDALMPQY